MFAFLLASCSSATESRAPSSPRATTAAVSLEAILGQLRQVSLQSSVPLQILSVNFDEADADDVAGLNLPRGQWLWITTEDPFTSADLESETDARFIGLTNPLEILREGLREFMPQLDDVVMIALEYEDALETVILIDPYEMRLYVDGELTTAQMIDKVVITSL